MATYHVFCQGVAFASGKSMLDVQQTALGTNTVKVWRIFCFNNQFASVTGVMTTLVIRHQNTSAASGTIIPIMKHRSFDPNVGAQITAGTNRTIGAGSTVRRIVWSNDEPAISAGFIDEWELLLPSAELWSSGYCDSNVEPLALVSSTAEGVDLQQSGSSAVGTIDAEMEFTVQ